ncbi:hypothetical protein B0H14DRAFT_2642189 [Mycena olivaceomarginata]|nr:hypothetical protein B0H14DRAFT_2642189 [Mycena olivaceomarginata]
MSSEAGKSLPAALSDADSQLLKDFGHHIMQDVVCMVVESISCIPGTPIRDQAVLADEDVRFVAPMEALFVVHSFQSSILLVEYGYLLTARWLFLAPSKYARGGRDVLGGLSPLQPT